MESLFCCSPVTAASVLFPQASETATGGFLQNSGMKACNFIKKRLQPRFSCKIREIFKNTYFEKHLWTIASVLQCIFLIFFVIIMNLEIAEN